MRWEWMKRVQQREVGQQKRRRGGKGKVKYEGMNARGI
jgi:hypothetical protein